MYSTIIEGRSQLSYVVTNDMMRDHKLAFMEPRPFLRWQMTQVINFDLSKAIESHVHDVDVILNDPREFSQTMSIEWLFFVYIKIIYKRRSSVVTVPFSREIQETGSGRLHIPSLDDDTWLCLKLRGE